METGFTEIRLALPVAVVQSTLSYLGRCPHGEVEGLIAAIRLSSVQVELHRSSPLRTADAVTGS